MNSLSGAWETTLEVWCAWCGEFIKYKDGHGTTGISHGIHRKCADKIMRKEYGDKYLVGEK